MSNRFVKNVLDCIRTAIGEEGAALHEPYFFGGEYEYIKNCLDSTYVSSVGPFVNKFEQMLSDYTGANYAVATVNGTSALHIALKLSGVEEGDEVLVPALTFAATANAITYCGAKPHFVDSSPENLGIDPLYLRDWLKSTTELRSGMCINKLTGSVIRALIPVHIFGHPCNIDDLLSIAKDYKLEMVEDAAESLGSFYFGKHTGTFGKLGVLSFNGNKIITTGGGGAILTNDLDLATKAKHLTTTAKLPHAWNYIHDQIGYNYRMPNINAALGCAQLENLGLFLNAKRTLYDRYKTAFSNCDGIKLLSEPEGCKSNYWLHAIRIDDRFAVYRDEILKQSNDENYITRPVWTLLNKLSHFENCPRMPLNRANKLEETIINIPSGPGLVLAK